CPRDCSSDDGRSAEGGGAGAMTTETAGELTLRVGDFEGPLDLLLHLCRTSEIDLAALPVRTITDQYLAHLEAIEFRDLETAGAFEANPPSVLERMAEILGLLRDTWSLLFSSLVGGERSRSEVVVSLLAVLELVRLGRIRVQQRELFGEIVLEASSGADIPS